MNGEEVRQAVSVALERVKDEDSDLLRFDVNERSITHRLGMYIQEEVGDAWDVDVEYNRIGEDDDVTKRVPPEELVRGSEGTVVPDVIIHHRGEEDNLLVIEAKKSSNPIGGDKQKLNAYVEYLDYTDGLYVEFDTGSSVDELDYYCHWHPFDE